MFRLKLLLIALVLLGASSGCMKYSPAPLVPDEVVQRVEISRQQPDGDPAKAAESGPQVFDFPRAVEWMATHGPALKEARAEFETARALAKVKTPLPNPALEIGPNYGFGPDVAKLYRVQPFGSIGFTIPTAGKRRKQDELNRVRAELLFIQMQAKHRELYLGLRLLYSQWILTRERLEARKKIAESAEKSANMSKKLVQGGFANALDLGLLELEAARIRTEALDAERELAAVEGEMSETIGVNAGQFMAPPEPALPAIPEATQEIAELREIMVANHPELARLRAQYEVAEAELRLEVAKQYPDFHFGPSFERETGEKKTVLGLTLGIDIPLFDRNQQGIASSKKRREEIRTKYEAAANRALASLEKTWRSIQLVNEKLKLLKNTLLPKANANLELARKSLETGATDALRFLETERGQRAVLIEALDTELSVREAWVDLEQAVGLPLVLFPGEKKETVPELNEGKNSPIDANPKR
ncbi:MAG: TolC family protein [Planctomycetota bacterium]|nr:TolC family protein [Planctomycetota bacterium]